MLGYRQPNFATGAGRLACAVLALLAAAGPGGAVTVEKVLHLNGSLSGTIEKGEYRVDSLVRVERGETLIVAPGTVFLFGRYAEMRVSGRLEALGTPEQPIVFTALASAARAGLAKPAPFGWNGIVLQDSTAEAGMAHVRIMCSTFGIKVKADYASLTLKNVLFAENGSANILIADTPVEVADGRPFDFVYPPTRPVDSLSVPRAALPAAGSPAARARRAAKAVRGGGNVEPWVGRAPMAVVFGALAVAGAGLAIGGQVSAVQYQREYESLSRGGDFDAVKKRRNGAIVTRNIGIPCLMIGAADFVLTLAIW